MSTAPWSGDSPEEHVSPAGPAITELYPYLKAVADMAWKNGIVFMFFLLSVFALVKSVFKWDGDQYVLGILSLFLWSLAGRAQRKMSVLDLNRPNLKAMTDAVRQSGMIFTIFSLSLIPFLASVLKWDGRQYAYFRVSFFLGLLFVIAHNRYSKIRQGLTAAGTRGATTG